ncbi:MAG: hypothetical protein AAF773_11740 [Cyanobacteria bacterium P01_D01_bin.115]
MPTCSDIITAPGSVDGWLKVGHVIDGQFIQLFGHEDTESLGVEGAIASARGQGFCSVAPPSSQVEVANASMPIDADPQGGVDPLWGVVVLGGLVTAFAGSVIGIYRRAVTNANQRRQKRETQLTYPTAGVYEPNPWGRQPSTNPFARALDEYALMDDEKSEPNPQSPDSDYQESGYMVQVYPGSHHRTTTQAATPEAREVARVVTDRATQSATQFTTHSQASSDPFDYAPFSFEAPAISPYERACVWVAVGENMPQYEALEKIYAVDNSQKGSTKWTRVRDRFQGVKEDIELQIQRGEV